MAGQMDLGSAIPNILMDDPIGHIEISDLREYVTTLYTTEFENKSSLTLPELWAGAKLAKNFGNHSPEEEIQNETIGGETRDSADEEIQDDDASEEAPARNSLDSSVSERRLIGKREREAIKVQESPAFWREPKDLVVTLLACCVASLTQGWDQVANGNLGWPKDLGLTISPAGTGRDTWKFGAANGVTWFSAAVLGPILVDPVCHSKFLGRRGAVFIAASFSFASVIGASRATSWGGYLISRLFLGVGIGAKASIVPIWESEILPQAKRGRLLVLWQVFTATGIFAGSVATYIFWNNWRNQVLTGAIPALILLILTYLCCESPRWLILQGQYPKAFDTLVRLRKERILAAEELCFIHFQVQTERTALLNLNQLDFNRRHPRIHYRDRVPMILTLARNRRAAIATMIVMLSQQLSGINILAFLASTFFSTAGLHKKPVSANPFDSTSAFLASTFSTANHQKLPTNANAHDSLRLAIGFGAANALFSVIAYFLIEPNNPNVKRPKRQPPRWMLGRRSLLLLSLAGGTLMLFILTFLLKLDEGKPAKLPIVMIFIILFTLFYSPGAGCVPFVYSAEVWPNEGREIGMSWAVFWNFLGAGLLATLVPRGLEWGPSRLFSVFTGLSFLGLILVFLFVPATGPAMSLDGMSRKFEMPLIDYSKKKIGEIIPAKKKGTSEQVPNPDASVVPPSAADDTETESVVSTRQKPGS